MSDGWRGSSYAARGRIKDPGSSRVGCSKHTGKRALWGYPSLKVLVADDSALYRRMLRDLLESWDYDVIIANDGNEALEALQGDEQLHLAILDGAMPGINGPELCQQMRAGQRDYVYTILLSASNSEEAVMHGFEFGADDYLCKPFKEFDLRARLRVGERIIQTQKTLADAQEALRFQATHDPLTHTWNRGGVMGVLEMEVSRARRFATPLAVCLADLDHFKRINDTYGHLTGDDVLRHTGKQMSEALRKYDCLGRYGGEEFLAVLPGCDREAALKTAERLRGNVESCAVEVGSTRIVVTVSIGVCQWCTTMSIEELLRQADVALYRAKENGRNRIEAAE